MLNFFKIWFGRRILFTASVFFQFIMPLVYLYMKSDTMTYNSGVKWRFWVMIFMMIYLIVVLKVVKKKVAEMRNNAFKRLINSSNIIVVILIVYLIYSILERAFIGADVFFSYFASFQLIGFILYNLDSFINNNWIQERRYEREGYDKAKVEDYKNKYLKKFEDERENKQVAKIKKAQGWGE